MNGAGAVSRGVMAAKEQVSTAGLSPAQAIYDERCRLPAGCREVALGIFAFFNWVWVVNALEEAYECGVDFGRTYEP